MGRERRAVFSIYGIMALISILIISIPEAQADKFPLIDGNAELDINPGFFLGVDSWKIDDTENLFSQWFYFRTDPILFDENQREFPIDKLPLVSTVFSNTDGGEGHDKVILTYAGPDLSIKISLTLKGGPADSGASTIFEEIEVKNTSEGELDVSFFQYTDFDLAGTSDAEKIDDTLEIFGGASNIAFQIDTSGSTALSETVVTPPPTSHEVAEFDKLLFSLNDAFVTILTGDSGPFTGDGEWVFQWDFSLDADETFTTIEKCKRIGPLSSGITGSIGDCEPIVNAPGDGAGGHEPPTIGMNLRGNYQIVTNGICIDAECWTVTENFHVDFKLVELFTSEHTISNTIYCSKGVDTCNHITLSAGPYHENTRNFDEALWEISLDKNLVGELTVTVDDPDDYLGVTTCTAQITPEELWFTSCTIDFKLPTPGGFMLGVQLQDNYKGVRNWFFNDGIEIIDTYGYPSVDTEFESSLDVPRLCLSDDPDKRTSCAFAKKIQQEIERAEKLLT